MAGGRLWSAEEDAFIAESVGEGVRNADLVEAFWERFGRGSRSRASIRKRRADLSAVDGRISNGPLATESLHEYQYIDGKFLFVINDRMLAVDFERWDQICRDYSEHGTNLTAAEVARRHGIPIPILKRCLAKYRHYKASPPSCRERIEEHKSDLEPLIAEAIENDEARFLEELAGRRDQEWRAEYVKLKREDLIHERLVEAARELVAAAPAVIVKSAKRSDSEGETWIAHIPTTDEHVGKRVWRDESFGENLDTYLSTERLRLHADAAADWMDSQRGRCAVAYRTLLGDMFHALFGETDHGTKLDQDTRYGQVWMETAEAVVYGLVQLSTVADQVVVKGAKGNHDGRAFCLFMYYLQSRVEVLALQGVAANVVVEPTFKPYDAFRVGTTLHVLDHGYRVGSLTGWKAKAQAEVVAREIGGTEYHGVDMIYTYVGHLHEDQKASHGGHLQLRRLPSLAESDDYETGLRYASRPGAHLFRLNAAGLITDERVLYRGDFSPDERA